ncbi:MAG: metallophosphoesterase [Clostridia bacterium]|nr:metallophosphoesterase [Clostridia bacterium]
MKKKIITVMFVLIMILSLFLFPIGCKPINDEKNVTPLWEAGATRDKIVVISDLHLGIEDDYTETLQNRPLLINFLKRLQNTLDVRELVIAGDFLDTWYLPVYYPQYTDENEFYEGVIANNQAVIDEFNNVIASGIKLVYVPGNHDMTLEADVLQTAIPNIVQARDAKGLGAYYTGDRDEIVIEHGHRYDAFSAPDSFSNKELCGNDDTILPAGYIYARYAATWVLEDYPEVEKNLPVISTIPDKTDIDQYGAYIYYSILKKLTAHITPNEGLDEKIFDMRVAGFNDTYSYLDFYPALQTDGTISAPVLFKNIQRTWDARQDANGVKVKNSFIEAALGAIESDYFYQQANAQYLKNPDEDVDVVVFGHTHIPYLKTEANGKTYLNSGTWVDDDKKLPNSTRTFAVITTGATNKTNLYRYTNEESISYVLPILG